MVDIDLQAYVRERLARLAPKRDNLRTDALAGLTNAISSVPGSMACAVMAGLNPSQGLYATMVGGPAAALTSGSVYMVVTTTSAMSLAAGAALAGLPEEQKLTGAVTLAIMVGIFQIGAGAARLGGLTRYISNSVMTGFMAGIAVLVVLSQLGDFTGLDFQTKYKILRPVEIIWRAQEIAPHAIIVGAVTVALVIALQRSRFGKLAMLIPLILVSLFVSLAGWRDVDLVGTSSQIPRALPRMIGFDLVQFPGLIASAIAIGIIGLVQSAGVSLTYANPDGRHSDTSRDFWSQGLANVASGMFCGMPIGGSSASTAMNINSGAMTRWSRVFAGIFLAIGVVAFGDAIERIPMAALAGLLVIVGVSSINVGRVMTVWQTSRVAAAMMGLTFIATLLFPVEQAVFLGVAASFLMAVVRESEKVRVMEIVVRPGRFPEERAAPRELPSRAITILLPNGSLFFAGARALENSLPDCTSAKDAAVILLLRGHRELGSTFIGIIRRYGATLQRNGGRLILAGVNSDVEKQLRKTGTIAQLGERSVIPAGNELIAPALAAYHEAQAWLASKGADDANATGAS